MSVPVENIMGGGGKKHRKQTKHHNGGFGLTGAVSAGLLLAAEELYRNSLKKGAKSAKGRTVGGNAGPDMDLHDSRMGSLLDEAFGKSLTAGGKRRYRKHRGGDDDGDGVGDGDGAESLEDKNKELEELKRENNELRERIEELEKENEELRKQIAEAPVNETGEKPSSGGRRRKGAMKGKKHMAMAWGGDGVDPATSFNMNDIAAEAQKAAEQSVGGRRRRHHAVHYRGGDSAAFAKFSDAMNNQMPPPANTSPMAHGPIPMGIESSGMGSPLAGGRRRRATKKHGGSTVGEMESQVSGMSGMIGGLLSRLY